MLKFDWQVLETFNSSTQPLAFFFYYIVASHADDVASDYVVRFCMLMCLVVFDMQLGVVNKQRVAAVKD